MQTEVSQYDALRDEINSRKTAVMNAKTLAAADRLDQYSGRATVGLASAKLEGYRRTTENRRSFNQSAERALNPPGQVGQPPSRLKPPQQYGHYALAPAQGSGANGAKGLGPASNGTGNGIVGVEAVNGDTEESPEDIICRQAKAIRTKTAKIQAQDEELSRYKALVDSVNNSVDEITVDSVATDQQVLQLADDLDEERRNHQAARYSLEQKTAEAEAARRSLQEESERLHDKTQEAEQRSRELAELETRSRAIHQENLELSARIARLVDEQQAEGPVAPEEGGGESTESPAVGEGGEDLQKELEKLKKMVEFKTGQLEAVTERASKASSELQYYKGQARSGRLWKLLVKLWWLLRTVGFLGFFLFVFMALEEGTLRSRGVDVYRLAT